MTKFACACVAAAIFVASSSSAQTVDRAAVPVAPPIVLQMDAIPTGSLVTMLLRDVMRVPYVIAPEVLQDRRPTSINLRIPRNDVPARVVGYLRKVGFSVTLEGGTVYVSRGGGGRSFGSSSSSSLFVSPQTNTQTNNLPLGSPVDLGRDDMPRARARVDYPSPQELEPAPRGAFGRPSSSGAFAGQMEELLAYVPAHRSPDFLAAAAGPLFPGVTFGARDKVQAEQSSSSIAPELGGDVLVVGGSSDDLARLRRLIEVLDRPRPMVAVKAVVLQVSDIRARGSALSILAKIGGENGSVSVGSFDAVAPASQFVRVAVGGFRALLSAVHEDSRIRVVASPNLAALSGAVATINAGSQVPTIGAVVVAEGGAPVQSVVYRDSGITLTVRPVVRGDLIELEVRQERSSFTRTTTGVEDSPTLNKASASASVVLKSGESVVLAGLTENSVGRTREGLLGGLLGIRTNDQSDSELAVILQAELVPLPTSKPGQFIDLKGEDQTDDDTRATKPVAPDPGRA